MSVEPGEQDFSQRGGDVGVVNRADAQGTPDLLETGAIDDQDTAGQPTAQVDALLNVCPREGAIDNIEQVSGQASLQADDRLGPVAEAVIAVGEQRSGDVQPSEVSVRIALRVLLAPTRGTQPHDARLVVHPRDTSITGDADAVHERVVDGEHSLLALRGCGGHSTKLRQKRMIDVPEVDVERRDVEVEVIGQAAQCGSAAALGHVDPG